MSRLAQFCLALFQRLYHLTSIRLLILFGLALTLAWSISNGEVTAQVLFQSPESPLVDPAVVPAAPVDPAVVPEAAPVEQPAAPEAPPVEQPAAAPEQP